MIPFPNEIAIPSGHPFQAKILAVFLWLVDPARVEYRDRRQYSGADDGVQRFHGYPRGGAES